MKIEEFAFLNQQLAGMLREGLPLEGSLRQLSAGLSRGRLRDEIQALEADLARGEPLAQAIEKRRLPELYRRLVRVGAAGQNLPDVLTQLAEHYQRRHALQSRLSGLLTYPFILLLASLGLAGLMRWLQTNVFDMVWSSLASDFGVSGPPPNVGWLTGGVALVLLCGLTAGLLLPPLRRWLAWKAPGFREANLARFADTSRMLLTAGTPLDETLALMAEVEAGSPAAREVRAWRKNLAEGKGRFQEFSAGSLVFPPLFRWLVDQGRDQLAAGFARAADIYERRARYRIEMLLYAALPVSILAIGLLLATQLAGAIRPLVKILNALGSY